MNKLRNLILVVVKFSGQKHFQEDALARISILGRALHSLAGANEKWRKYLFVQPTLLRCEDSVVKSVECCESSGEHAFEESP